MADGRGEHEFLCQDSEARLHSQFAIPDSSRSKWVHRCRSASQALAVAGSCALLAFGVSSTWRSALSTRELRPSAGGPGGGGFPGMPGGQSMANILACGKKSQQLCCDDEAFKTQVCEPLQSCSIAAGTAKYDGPLICPPPPVPDVMGMGSGTCAKDESALKPEVKQALDMCMSQHNKSPKKQKAPETRGPIPKDKDGTPVGIKCSDGDLAQIQEWMNGGIASFDDDKEMVMRCSCQNYVFTAKQAATLIRTMTWDDNQVDAVEMFRDRLTNPDERKVILDEINEDAKSNVEKLLKEFKAAKPVGALAYPLEDHGVRDDEVVNDFIKKLSVSFVNATEVAEEEMRDRPSPPFSAKQLATVLETFTFGSELPAMLETLAGPKAIYPLTCAEIGRMTHYGKGGVKFMINPRLEMIEALKPLIKDAQNKPLLVASFEFPDDKNKAEIILRDVMVNFRFEPPEAKIQAAIKAVGSCVSGYQWMKVRGGWRCAAGGHYLSDARVNAQLALM